MEMAGLEPGEGVKLPYGVKFTPNPGPKIFIPVSCNGSGYGKTAWAISLATAFVGRHVRIENMGGSHADRACNNMANFFLRTDCDVMLIVDIDTEFTAKDVARAIGHIERGHKAVWGLYPKKQDECVPCLNTWPEVPPPDEHGLVNVRRAGRGFLMITRDVFEMLKRDNGGPAVKFFNHDEPEWAFFRSGVVEGRYSAMLHGEPEWISEDWHLCEDLRIHLGIPTLVDTGIVLAHIGSKTYRFPKESLVRVDSHISSWRDIHGWFDYEDLYRMLVAEIPDRGAFLEVGCWLGRSLGAFEEFSTDAEKSMTLFAVDTFKGKPANNEHAAILNAHGGSVLSAFKRNMTALGLEIGGNLHILEGDSASEAANISDETMDAIFIDADHGEESVSRDISAWWPKVKPGGILAGHDFDEPGVLAAVDRAFSRSGSVETIGRCWLVRKPKAE